jgi:hypothetical protein
MFVHLFENSALISQQQRSKAQNSVELLLIVKPHVMKLEV